jgi:hypothetical protein
MVAVCSQQNQVVCWSLRTRQQKWFYHCLDILDVLIAKDKVIILHRSNLGGLDWIVLWLDSGIFMEVVGIDFVDIRAINRPRLSYDKFGDCIFLTYSGELAIFQVGDLKEVKERHFTSDLDYKYQKVVVGIDGTIYALETALNQVHVF